MGFIKRFWDDEEGLAITEYGILVAFVAFVFIAAVITFGTQFAAWFTSKASTITTN